MASKKYVVTAPLVIANLSDDNGNQVGAHYCYEGAVLPENTNEEQLKQLLESDMVREATKDEVPAVKPAK